MEKKDLTVMPEEQGSDIMRIRGSFFNNVASRYIKKWIFKNFKAKGLISVEDLDIRMDPNGCSFSIQINGGFNSKNTEVLKNELLKKLLIGE